MLLNSERLYKRTSLSPVIARLDRAIQRKVWVIRSSRIKTDK